jgi:hypothetical protein
VRASWNAEHELNAVRRPTTNGGQADDGALRANFLQYAGDTHERTNQASRLIRKWLNDP